MKKILFAAVHMNVGGIENALLTLLNYLVNKDYKITLVLEEKQGIFLRDLDNRINIVQYAPSKSNNIIIRKSINLLKRLNFILKYKNKFDFSASFATYSRVSSFVARTASKNNVLWGHADYLELYNGDKEKVKSFFSGLNYEKFKKIVFVSKKACESFIEVLPEAKDKVVFCNNLIDYKKIENLSNEEIEEKKDAYTFVNVGRHDEQQKKLTRILEASEKLKNDNINFEVLFIGEGKDTEIYKIMAEKMGLQNKIKFLGVKKNPYPYMKLADAVVLSSDYEGYPVVFLEALILNKPIITTNVADALEDIKGKYGEVVEKTTDDLYKTMKQFIEHGYVINRKFDPEEYNRDIIGKLEKLINNKM
ncbi:MAG: glycosyltransferase [Clostridia bacterium]|nr:glycosyltransferase [Clostridia bacterium]